MKRNTRVGVPTYTYRQSNKKEEKVIYRRIAIIGVITIILLIIIWFWGVTFIRIIGALGIRNTEETTQTNSDLPLLKPNLFGIEEYTNKDKITISGTTTAGVSTTLIVNGTEVSKTTSDQDGGFSFVDVHLKDGINLVKVVVANNSNETEETQVIINVDKTPPDLQIAEPKDNQKYPKDTKNITIKGLTEPDMIVFVNGSQALLDHQGNFTYIFSVSPGENKIEIKASDKAGNYKVENLIVTVEL